jgi:hypothetical protein
MMSVKEKFPFTYSSVFLQEKCQALETPEVKAMNVFKKMLKQLSDACKIRNS